MKAEHKKKRPEPGSYSLEWKAGWEYGDHPPGIDSPNLAKLVVENPLQYLESSKPHFILKDSSGRPRWVIRYYEAKRGQSYVTSVGSFHAPSSDRIVISSVQRVRSQYVPGTSKRFRWDPEAETAESKKLKASLGKHPPDFILSEFLKAHGDRLRQDISDGNVGASLEPGLVEFYPGVYDNLIGKFFKSTKDGEIILDPTKRLVRKSLQAQTQSK